MSENGSAATLAFTLNVDAALAARRSVDALRRSVERSLSALVAELRLRAEVRVALHAESPAGGRLVELRLGESRLDHPDSILVAAWEASSGNGVNAPDTAEALVASARASDASVTADFVGHACREIAALHVTRMLTPDVVLALTHRAEYPALEEAGAVVAICETLAELRIAPGRVTDLRRYRFGDSKRSMLSLEAREVAATRLSRDDVLILLPREDLERLTRGAGAGDRELLVAMRDGLQYELGITLPALRFAEDPELRPRSFRLRIQDMTTLPRLLLPEATAFTDRPGDGGPRFGRWRHPVTGAAGSLIAEADAASRRQFSTVWTKMEYLVLAAGADLRLAAASFMTLNDVQARNELLAGTHPDLVRTVNALLPPERIAAAARRIIAEGVSVRNWRVVLDRLLQVRAAEVDLTGKILFDDRIVAPAGATDAWRMHADTQASFVRLGMKRALGHKYTAGDTALRCWLLDQDLERLLRARETLSADGSPPPGLSKDEHGRLLDTVRTAAGSAALGIVLTSVDVRAPLRRLLEHALPGVSVLCFEELPPGLNIQPADERLDLRD